MKEKSIVMVRLLVLAALLLAPASLLAAGGEGHGGGNQIVDLGWRVLNFLIFAGILYFAAAKAARNFLGGRIEGIRKELGDAEKGKEEAEKRLQEYLQRLAGLEAEVKDINDTLRKEGEIERERIIESARQEVEKIKAQAKYSAEQETSRAVAAIREEMAAAAVSLAEKLLAEGLGKEDQKRLVAEYLEGLGEAN